MLNDLVALDLAGLQGQFTGRILADLGMRVIKVEPPGGDRCRAVGPFKDSSTPARRASHSTSRARTAERSCSSSPAAPTS